MEIVVAKRTKRKGTSVRAATKKVVNKPKPKSLSKLKKELDAVVSKYVRWLYSVNGMTFCFTCDKHLETRISQCGHFVSRQYLATRWELDNLRVQCVGCNIWGNGKLLDFEEHLIREIGAERVQALKYKRKELWKLDRNWYETQIAHYKSLVEPLTNNQ